MPDQRKALEAGGRDPRKGQHSAPGTHSPRMRTNPKDGAEMPELYTRSVLGH
jgi:hypothetical protein